MPTIDMTRRAVERLAAPDPSGRQVLYWDRGLRGFGILVSGSTATKSYIVQRKIRGSTNTRRVTIDRTDVISLEQARERAMALLANLGAGVDPKAERRRAATRDKTLAVAMAEYLRDNSSLAESSRAVYRGSVERYLTGWLTLPIREITREMVERRHRAIAEEIARPGRSGGGVNTGKATADGAMRALRAVYNHQMDKDPTLPPCPVRLRKSWFNVAPRERFLSGDQLPAFYTAVDNLPSRLQSDFLKLLLWTGLRRNEPASLRWSEVDFATRTIRLPAARTKAGRKLDLPMSSFVHSLLVARRAIGRDSSDFVFPASTRTGHIAEPRAGLDAAAKATGVAITPHDLRRTFLTHAEQADVSWLALKALVNHSIGGDVTENYTRITTERLRDPAQRVCDRLMALCEIEVPDGHNVAALG